MPIFARAGQQPGGLWTGLFASRDSWRVCSDCRFHCAFGDFHDRGRLWFQAIGAQSGFLHGLKLAAVAVVAQAVWTMALKLCPDRERLTLAIVAACVVLSSPVSWLQVVRS